MRAEAPLETRIQTPGTLGFESGIAAKRVFFRRLLFEIEGCDEVEIRPPHGTRERRIQARGVRDCPLQMQGRRQNFIALRREPSVPAHIHVSRFESKARLHAKRTVTRVVLHERIEPNLVDLIDSVRRRVFFDFIAVDLERAHIAVAVLVEIVHTELERARPHTERMRKGDTRFRIGAVIDLPPRRLERILRIGLELSGNDVVFEARVRQLQRRLARAHGQSELCIERVVALVDVLVLRSELVELQVAVIVQLERLHVFALGAIRAHEISAEGQLERTDADP